MFLTLFYPFCNKCFASLTKGITVKKVPKIVTNCCIDIANSSSFFSKLLNRIRRGTIPCIKINKRVKNIHQALENQSLVVEGAQHLGVEVQNINAEDLWSGKVWPMSRTVLHN